MTVRTVLTYPDSRLRKKAAPVAAITPAIKNLVADMYVTMYFGDRAVGLAATQINVQWRVITMDISNDKSEAVTLINPTILHREGLSEFSEGCISLPGVYEKLDRADKVTVETLTLDGRTITMEADGLLSVCIQHEIDHLDGILLIDHLSRLKRSRIGNKLKKLKHQEK